MVRRSVLFIVAACLPAFGDFSYDQTSKITGGMMAGAMKFNLTCPRCGGKGKLLDP